MAGGFAPNRLGFQSVIGAPPLPFAKRRRHGFDQNLRAARLANIGPNIGQRIVRIVRVVSVSAWHRQVASHRRPGLFAQTMLEVPS